MKSKQISLAALLSFVTLMGFVCKFVSDLRAHQLKQLAVISEVRSRGLGNVFYTHPKEGSKWLWNLLGVREPCTITGIAARDGALFVDDLKGVMLGDVEQIRLSGSKVRDSWLREIESKKLKAIALANCEISDGGFKRLTLNQTMGSISLSKCPLTNASLQHISNTCRTVEWLSLGGTHVDDSGMELLKRVSVKALSLAETSISDKGLDFIASSQAAARILCLDGTEVSDVGVEKLLAGCSRLELLQLNRCENVTSTCLEKCVSHPMLRRVELSGTSIQYGDIAKIRGVREDGVAVSTLDSGSAWQGWVLFKRPSHANTKSFLGGGMF